jgi:hypothetical protein
MYVYIYREREAPISSCLNQDFTGFNACFHHVNCPRCCSSSRNPFANLQETNLGKCIKLGDSTYGFIWSFKSVEHVCMWLYIHTQIYDILNICIIFIYFIVHLGNTLYLMIAIMKLARQSTWWSNLNSDNQSCIHLSCLLLFVGHREQFGIKDQTMRINLSTRPASVHTLFAYMANSTKEYQRYTTGWGPPVISWFIYHYNPHSL